MAITTSPYINGPDILEHATHTVKEVHLDFSGVADGCIKAGSPISAAGKVANDATAIGILLHDNYSDCGCGHGMVVVAGRIKADVAEQHSGIKISAEAKGGMPCVAFVDAAGVVTGGNPGGGVTSWNDLTDKPFGEEKSKIAWVEDTTITWGNFAKSPNNPNSPEVMTEGREFLVVLGGAEYFCKTVQWGQGFYVGNASLHNQIENGEDTGEPFVFDLFDSYNGEYWRFHHRYVPDYNDELISIYEITSAIKPLDEEYMPLLTAPNGTKYKLTVADDGTLSAVAVE